MKRVGREESSTVLAECVTWLLRERSFGVMSYTEAPRGLADARGGGEDALLDSIVEISIKVGIEKFSSEDIAENIQRVLNLVKGFGSVEGRASCCWKDQLSSVELVLMGDTAWFHSPMVC